MKSLKIFIIFTVNLLLFSLPLQISNACGPDFQDDDVIRFMLFQPDANGMAEYEPFFFTTHYLNDADNHAGEAIARNKNIMEWQQKLGKQISAEAIEALVYTVSPSQYAETLRHIKEGNAGRDSIMQNQMLQALLKPVNAGLLAYLSFAKECEYYIFEPDPWQERPSENIYQNAGAYIKLQENALKMASSEKDTFLKLRYAFQYLKLTRRNDKEDRIKVYNKYIAPLKSGSIVAYWAQYHNAISHYNNGSSEADYMFAQLFDKAEDKRVGIYQNFTGEETEQTLSFCKNNHEKALVHVVKALKNPGRCLDELITVYKLEPGSRELKFLLNREINKLEDWLMTPAYKGFSPLSRSDYWERESFNPTMLINIKADKKYLQQVREFTQNVLADNKAGDKAYWLITNAYLSLLAGELGNCETFLGKAAHINIGDKMLKHQFHLTKLMLTINQTQKNSVKFEKTLADELQWLHKNRADFKDYWKCRRELFTYLAKRYEQWADIGRAALMLKHAEYEHIIEGVWVETDYYNYLEAKAQPTHIDTILKILDKPEKSAFELLLLKDSVPFTTFAEHNDRLLNEDYWDHGQIYTKYAYRAFNRFKLLDIKGMLLLRQQKVRQAYKVYQMIPDSFWQQEPYTSYLDANPFFVNRDNPHAPHFLDSIRYNKRTILQRMLRLEDEAEKIKSKRAHNYFLLANAWYNFSYHGNSWMMLRNYWSVSESESRNEGSEDFYKVYYGNSVARKYYSLALKHATNEKFAALCAIRAWECSENYYTQVSGKNKYANHYMRSVRTKFGSTKALDELQECDMFNKYVVNYY